MRNLRQLYKYCSFCANSLSILITGKAWYSKPADFNDPFDGDFSLDSSCSFDEYMEIFGHEIKPEIYESLKLEYCGSSDVLKPGKIKGLSAIAEALKNVGVLCLTTRRDSVLMWSHYADEHKGFTIKFDVPAIVPVNKVNYNSYIPDNPLSFFFKKSRNDGYLDYQFTKHVDWEYENEYRISVNRGNRLVDIPGKIIQIDFGCRMQDSHKETIFKAIKAISYAEEIKLYYAVKAGNLKLVFLPYDIKT